MIMDGIIQLREYMIHPHRATSLGSSKRGRRVSVFIMYVLSISMAGCGFYKNSVTPTTLGQAMSGYTYIPIDPAKVHIEPGICSINFSKITDDAGPGNHKLLDLLPDNAVRMSM